MTENNADVMARTTEFFQGGRGIAESAPVGDEVEVVDKERKPEPVDVFNSELATDAYNALMRYAAQLDELHIHYTKEVALKKSLAISAKNSANYLRAFAEEYCA